MLQTLFRRCLALRRATILRAAQAQELTAQREAAAATLIQKHARGMSARRALHRLRVQASIRLRACVALQAFLRGCNARRRARELSQARERLREADVEFQQAKLQAALEKQQQLALRQWALRRLARLVWAAWTHYVCTNEAFLRRKHARLHGAATHIQRVWMGFAARKEAARRRHAIISLQAHWRSRAVRRCQPKAMRSRLRAIELRLVAARRAVALAGGASAPQTVGSRTRAALEILLGGRQLSGVLVAMQTLAATTGLLPSCCVEAVEQGALPALFSVLRSLNRSKPHLLLLEATLNVFHHLAREPRTRYQLLHAAGAQLVDTFTDALQAYIASPTIVLKIARVLQEGLITPARRSAASAATAAAEPDASLPLRVYLSANTAAQKRLTGVQSLLERKLVVEMKSSAASSGRRLPAAPASKTAVAAKRSAASVAPRHVPFDAFWCACHGSISSGATCTPAERTSQLQACSDHMAKLTSML